MNGVHPSQISHGSWLNTQDIPVFQEPAIDSLHKTILSLVQCTPHYFPLIKQKPKSQYLYFLSIFLDTLVSPLFDFDFTRTGIHKVQTQAKLYEI